MNFEAESTTTAILKMDDLLIPSSCRDIRYFTILKFRYTSHLCLVIHFKFASNKIAFNTNVDQISEY